MKNIIFVTRNMQAGGTERVISQLVKYMSCIGIKCSIITLEAKDIFYDLPPQVKIFSIGKKSRINFIDKLLRYKEIRYLVVQNIKPDIVLALPEEIGIYVIPSLLATKIPVVVSERNNPWVMPVKKITRIMRIVFYPFASGFIFQTDKAASYFPSYIRKRAAVLPNPLDLTRIPQPWKGLRRKEIVSAGRLEKQKNFPLLIKAFAKFHKRHPDYKLIIYGQGSLKNELEELSKSLLPQESYLFPGTTTTLLEEIRGSAMFVLSSNYEGIPNVLIEAMAIGMPVISTDCPVGGPASLIKNGENGLLVPVGDVDKMCDAMCKIAESKVLSENLSINALSINKRLDSKVVSEQWRQYLDAVSSSK